MAQDRGEGAPRSARAGRGGPVDPRRSSHLDAPYESSEITGRLRVGGAKPVRVVFRHRGQGTPGGAGAPTARACIEAVAAGSPNQQARRAVVRTGSIPGAPRDLRTTLQGFTWCRARSGSSTPIHPADAQPARSIAGAARAGLFARARRPRFTRRPRTRSEEKIRRRRAGAPRPRSDRPPTNTVLRSRPNSLPNGAGERQPRGRRWAKAVTLVEMFRLPQR